MSCDRYVQQLKNLFSMIRHNTINDRINIYPIINSIVTTQNDIHVISGAICTNLPNNNFVSKTLNKLILTTNDIECQKMIRKVIYNHSLIRETSGLSGFSRSRKNRSRGARASRRASRRAINRSKKAKSRRVNRSRRGRN